MNLIFRQPSEKEFEEVCEHIKLFELDNRALNKADFIVAFRNEKLVAFGRLRQHNGFVELCSLGVLVPYRNQGIGKALVRQLIENTTKNIYLVCIIPDYFLSFNFKTIEEYPLEIENKIKFCTDELVVPEKYVAMLLEKQVLL